MVNAKTDVSVTVASVGEIEVTVWNAAQLDINTAVAYIKSGQREIQEYVNNVNKPELNAYTSGCKEEITDYLNNKTKPEIDIYVSEDKKSELDVLSEAKQEEISDYVEKVSKPVIDNYVTSEVENLVSQAQNSRDEAASFSCVAAASAQSAANSETEALNSETAAAASEARCEEIFARLGTVIKIKGRVDAPEDLPAAGNLDGDAYLVGAAGLASYPEYYWFSDHWEFLGTSADKIEWGTLQGTLANQTDLQTALNAKQATITGAASTITSSNLTANMALRTDGNGKITNSSATSTELSYLSGVSSNIQTQLNAKQTTSNLSQSLDTSSTKYPSNAAVSNAISNIDMSAKANVGLDNLSSTGNTVIDNRIISILSTLYPVGSVYIGTQSTCPLATLISGSSWSKVATNIVINVQTSVPVKGNGMTLGLTDGTNLTGLTQAANPYALYRASNYGGSVGASATLTYPTNQKLIGVTTDSSKSGIVGTVTRTNLAVNIWKRTA